MKRPSFFRGVVVAAVLALFGAIAFSGLSLVVGGAPALKIVTMLLGGAYIVYLLRGANDRTGRIAVFVVWGFVTSGVWFFTADVAMTLVNQAVLISIVRALYHHASVLAGVLDLVLTAFALSAAVWASTHSGSMFLTVWCFFLVQALFVGIPSEFNKSLKQGREQTIEDEFSSALRAAETAIKRIATQR